MNAINTPNVASTHDNDENFQILTELKSANLSDRYTFILRFALHRYFTFPNTFSCSVSRFQLANCGFFLTENEHSVQCIFCKLELYDNFANVTNLNSKHRELNPACPFVTGDNTGNIPIVDPTNYCFEAHRLYSFLSTPWTAPVTTYELAKHGFYWTGSTDNCRCVFCRLEIRGWEEGDTAENEHLRWNPNCVFMNKQFVGNVPIGSELEDLNLYDVAGHVRQKIPSSNNTFVTSRSSNFPLIQYIGSNTPSLVKLGVTMMDHPRHTEYASHATRLESYKMWPISLNQRPVQLAAAGFYYTGCGDRVICFMCGGGLKDWTLSDIPWFEHAKWFPRCTYLLMKKGKQFVDDVNYKQFEKKQKPSIHMSPLGLDLFNHTENERNKMVCLDRLRCVMCGARDIETVNLPCGDMTNCINCVNKEENCSRCGRKRIAYIKIFLQ